MTKISLVDIAKKATKTAKDAGADDARAYAWRSRQVKVEWRDGKLDRIRENTERGISVTLYVDGRYSSNSTADLRDEAVEDYIKGSVAMTRHLAVDKHRRLPDPKRYEGMTTKDLQIRDPGYEARTPEQRLATAKQLEDTARDHKIDAEIVSVTASVSDNSSRVACVSTNGFEGQEERTSFWSSSVVSVKGEGDRKPRGWSVGGGRFLEDQPEIPNIGADAAERAAAQIGSKQVDTGSYDLIIENRSVPRVAGYLLGPLSGYALQQKSSYLEGMLEKKVGSKLLTITSDPHLVRGLASTAWDSEGMTTVPRAVFDKGVLKTYFMDTYYASKLDKEPTSSSKTNLVWSGGKRDAEAMIKNMKKGIFVTELRGGNSNSTTGDFSVGIKGFLIKDGKKVHPVSEMNIAGNHLELWKNLVEVGSDPWKYSSNRAPSLRFKDVKCSGTGE